MDNHDEQAQSFGAIAGDYDRLRPPPPDAAVDWLVPAACRDAVDVAAGTGLFTRALLTRVPHVVAVEPDERMRAVLAARTLGADVVAGTGEELPLPDDSADGVFVSSAWHWLDHARAVPEIARVLRPGGRLGVIWTSRDREVDWVRDLDRMRTSLAQESDDSVQAQRWKRIDMTLPEPALFTNADRATFPFVRPMALADVVAMVGTYSVVITARPEEREAGLQRVRSALLERFGAVETLDVPMRSWCWRGDLAA